MAGGACAWSRRVAARMRTLRGLVRDTQRALHDVCDIINFDPDIFTTVQEIGNLASKCTALVLLGTSSTARARLLHCLLGRKLLPEPMPRGCRWLRIQYGSNTQVHLTLGNSEFELVEELECNKRPWDVLPVEDLIRKHQTDLTTVLEVELNNPFLKDGLKIIIPPDIDVDSGPYNYLTLKQIHSEWYTKREAILKNFNLVYLYGIDRTGKNIFSDNISTITTSRSEEDFWTTFNLYSMARVDNNGVGDKCDSDVTEGKVDIDEWKEASNEPAVFSAENCLDLHQVKEIAPNSQVFFFLFSDSVDINRIEENRRQGVEDLCKEATESTEDAVYNAEDLPESDQGLVKDGVLRHTQESLGYNATSIDNRRLYEEQIAFMNELLDQWEMMSSPSPKKQARGRWRILDEEEILRTANQKAGAPTPHVSENLSPGTREGDSDRIVNTKFVLNNKVLNFATDCLQSYLLEFCTKLSEVHVKLLQQFILASFDLARELQVVPKKIHYVAKQEQQLFETINEKFSEGDKKQELLQIMHEVLNEMKIEVNQMDWSVDDLPCHQDRRFIISNSVFYSSSRCSPDLVSLRLPEADQSAGPSHHLSDHLDVEEAVSYDTYNFDDYDIIRSNDESLTVSDCYRDGGTQRADDVESITSQIGEIHVENEVEMLSLPPGGARGAWGSPAPALAASLASAATSSTCTNTLNISIKQASLDVQQTVLSRLSRKISLRLVKFVDCLRDSYFGTLQRCLESLERSCRAELGGRPASEAARRLLAVARQVDLQPCASFSLLRALLESLRRFFYRFRMSGGEAAGACCVLSAAWRRQVAATTAHSLSAHRLAKFISTQMVERVCVAHERYQAALAELQAALASRLHHTEDVRLAIRKKYAPAFARLCLESTSMCDLLMYGTPELGREIGRGQYGVVYAARGRGWAGAGAGPAAVKSVLPADERHYHELAMEFFYTRSIPPHPRIVRLYGSVVQRHGGGGGGPTVLLVSQRKCRDLHAAVRAGLSFAARMRIACDIVEGIRYLHSLGLVHRDIKMKNVLLDSQDRAALSDLGFCTAEALMSGSVVGTPVHMAPELLAGEYDAAVDVYAFGILFWYVCAGNIKLPSAFETFQNKEQLWSKVKRGLRPERLPHFSDECWRVMTSCWASEPSQRALLGDVQPTLERILETALKEDQGKSVQHDPGYRGYDLSDDDSLEMTGIDKDCM